MDVSSSASVSSLMSEVKDKYSSVPTIAVNSAGITRDTFMLKMKEEMWDEVINVNLKVCLIRKKMKNAFNPATYSIYLSQARNLQSSGYCCSLLAHQAR